MMDGASRSRRLVIEKKQNKKQKNIIHLYSDFRVNIVPKQNNRTIRIVSLLVQWPVHNVGTRTYTLHVCVQSVSFKFV